MSRARHPRVRRLLDLLAALLRRRYRATCDDLFREVPAYSHAPNRDALLRAFERDKDALRSFGVPIHTVSEEEGEPVGYVLRRREFYLPYIEVVRQGGQVPVERSGYRDLARVVLTGDEIAALDAAAMRVRQLGDPALSADAEAAMRKLAFDLPAGTFVSLSPLVVVAPDTPVEGGVCELLEWALLHRKRATFSYRSPGSSDSERREVEPYGLFFRAGHWHLAAFDAGRAGVVDFSVEHIAELEVNVLRVQSPDYELPAGFDLRRHAGGRWEWPARDAEPTCDPGLRPELLACVRATLAVHERASAGARPDPLHPSSDPGPTGDCQGPAV